MQVGLLLLLLLLVQLSANAGSLISNKYDNYFKDVSIFLPVGTDYRLLKAQCNAESNLNPLAVSPVGAIGICQFMPNTADGMTTKYPDLVNFWLPETSIRAAALYMNQLNSSWSSPRPDMDRWLLASASYNAGLGNLIKSQSACSMKLLYGEIIKCLPQVTGRHSTETVNYNKRILGFYIYLLLE